MTSRALVSLGDERIAKLDRLAKQRSQSRSAVVREAVDKFITENAESEEDAKARFMAGLEAGFGLWARAGIAIDPHEYERLRRAEWTRPWDDDYEEVRAESPECFNEYDDKERAHYLALTRRAVGQDDKPGE